ncbi:MAG: hypothetical protein JKX85_06245 [Phycisphaeraceae bacterium]|nr:hypothetical protein [Phycisphaeraceae bacterium]
MDYMKIAIWIGIILGSLFIIKIIVQLIMAVIEFVKISNSFDEVKSPDNTAVYQELFSLRNEIDCRIDHGANGSAHLEYVKKQLTKVMKQC